MRGILIVVLVSVLSFLSVLELLALNAVTNGDIAQVSETLSLCSNGAGSTSDTGMPAPRNAFTRTNRRFNNTLRGGYVSPVDSMLKNFPNDAVENEVMKHDRWVVDALAYINTFSVDDAKHYASIVPAVSSSSPKLITVVVLTVNRAVPYIAVTLSTLLRGISPTVFMQSVDLHVINVERRPGRTSYGFFTNLESKFGTFVKFEDWSDNYKETEHIVKMNKPQPLYMENQRLDIIRSLKICKERKSEWCLLVEDDAVFPVNFISKFEKHINVNMYENATLPGGPTQNFDSPPLDPGADNSTGPVFKGRVAMVKLYAPFNDRFRGRTGPSGGNIKADDYNMDDYDKHRALDLYETQDTRRINVKYDIRASYTLYGMVANAYPKDRIDLLISYLTNKKRWKAYPTDQLLNYDLIIDTKMALLETQPSMVGHIGFYREHHDAGSGIGEISTDIRFQLDDGPAYDYDDEMRKRGTVSEGTPSRIIGKNQDKLRGKIS